MLISTRFCPVCGAANEPEQTNCFACGHHLDAEMQEEMPPLRDRYQIRATLGYGGYSVVYHARDLKAGRDVAVKRVTLSGLSAEETIEATDTFNRELNMLQALHHPQVPRLYDHFSDRDHWYLVLEYLEGTTLETYLATRADKDKPVPFQEVLAIGLQLCTVLDYLHTCQPPVIFRDLKPGNIIRSSRGKLSLIDFGIARYYRKGQAHDTRNLGSPGYASPEQYGSAQTTPRSDLYSLGALLHALLSGQDPAERPRGQGLAPLHLEQSAAGKKLAELIRRLLAPKPEQRPAGASEVATELEAIRRLHQSLDTSRIWYPPQPAPVVSPASQQQQIQQFQQQYQAQVQAQKKATRRRFIKRGLFGIAAFALTIPTLRFGVPALSSLLSGSNSNVGSFGQAYSDRHRHFPGSSEQPAQGSYVSQIVWSPDGQQFALISNTESVSVYQAGQGGGPSVTFGVAPPKALAWAPDSQRLAIGFQDGSVMLVDVYLDSLLTYSLAAGPVENIAWSPDGEYIASVDPQNLVRVCYLGNGSGNVVPDYAGLAGASTGDTFLLAWSPDSTRLVIQGRASSAHSLAVWSVKAGVLYTFASTPALAVAWSPDGSQIATVDQTTLYLWDASTGKASATYPVRNPPYPIAFNADLVWSPDSSHLVLDTGYSTLQIWDIRTGVSMLRPIYLDVTRTMIWLPDGRLALVDDNLRTEYLSL
ncbi:MAG TPA: protein kinase [Ktedonobacteraceae bacterium]|nr:protein kinase [Ktedonobacteraceae bacterium]